MKKKERKNQIFVFFPCDGKIGGAERRLIRTFTYISKTNAAFEFTIGFQMILDVDKDRIESEYRMFTDLPIMFFYSQTEVYNYIKKSIYDVLCYTDCSYRCLPVLLAAKLSHKKNFMMCTDTMGSSQHLKPFFRQLLYNFDIKMSDRIDCLYPGNTKLLQSKFKKKKITCTPCSFTDTNKYVPRFPKKKEIIFMGRLVSFKGIDLFVDAIIKVADKIREKGYCCYIYGHGDMEQEIKDTITNNNCEDIIICKGHITDSSEVFMTSRIFCSLQTLGNYPSQSMLEAMACGNYCIVTDTYDSHLLVKDSFGQLVSQESNSLSKAIVQAMSFTDEKFEQIAIDARLFVLQNHTIQLSADYFAEIFDELTR